jgi:hypothetical protein
VLLVAATLFACGGPQLSDGDLSGAPPPMVGWGDATVLGGGGVLRYAFTMEAGALGQLISTATSERYLPALLSVSGEEVGMVGLRYKASSATLDSCFEAGQQICSKASFKVSFDFSAPTRRFHSVERLNFHSTVGDPSLLHERLNAKLFAEMGVVAPRVSHAEITINGENKGVFAVVEEVDRVFLQEHWKPGGNGNLYKEVWPNDLDPETYDRALESATDGRDHSGMVAFAQELSSAKPQELAGVLNHFADVDYLIRYLAVDRAISNWGGMSAFYCNEVGFECSNHNYYWYQVQGQHRFWLIPSDLGNTLSLHTPLDSLPEWDHPPADCTLRFRIEESVLFPSGCDPLFRGLQGAGRGAYVAALDRLLQVWDLPALYRQIEDWGLEIQGAVARDSTLPGLGAWQAAVRSLKRDLQALRERIENIRDDMTGSGFGLRAPGLTDFESATPLGFLLSVSSEGNARSGVVHDLNRSNPIGGTADARLDFELRNDSNQVAIGAFSQFAILTLPLEKLTPLSGLRRIRMRISADAIRAVRIELTSANYPPDGERYGWRVLAGQRPEAFAIDVGELALGDESRRGPVPIAEILSSVTGLAIIPEPRGRSEAGLLPAGKADVGFVHIDDISIETQ